MAHEDIAPPKQSWTEHLHEIDDEELTSLAGDYCWILEKNRPEAQRGEFVRRRSAILAECERRGLEEAARNCRPAPGARL